MDLLVTANGKTLCIDLIGFPGELQEAFSIDQYKTLFRTDIPIIAIPYVYWLVNKEACLHEISKRLSIKTTNL